MSKPKIKAKAKVIKKTQPIIKEPNFKRMGLIGVAGTLGIILIVFLLNIDMVPYWFGRKDPVAKVDSKPIYSKEVKADLVDLSIQYANMVGKSLWDETSDGDSSINSSAKDTLDDIIQKRVQTTIAKKRNLKLSDTELKDIDKKFDSEYATLKKNSGNILNQGLSIVSIPESYFKKVYRQSSIDQKLIDKLKKDVLVKDYKKTLTNKDLERITVKEIYIAKDTLKGAKAKNMITEIDKKLKAGTKFNDILKDNKYKKYLFNSDKNGLIGTIGRYIMPKEFDKVAFSIKPGKLSNPIKTKLGYHIILVDKHTYGNIKHLTAKEIKEISESEKYVNYYSKKVKGWKNDANVKTFVTDFKIGANK